MTDIAKTYRLLGLLWCKLTKHKRGKREDCIAHLVEANGTITNTYRYRCPRCHETWMRKIRKVKKEATNGN